MHLKPTWGIGYVLLQLVQLGHINDILLDRIEEWAQLYDWVVDLVEEDTTKGN